MIVSFFFSSEICRRLSLRLAFYGINLSSNVGSGSPVISKAFVSGLISLFFLIPLIFAGQNNISRKSEDEDKPVEEGFINCCFSFTIRRDKWGTIPSMIVGNFIKC